MNLIDGTWNTEINTPMGLQKTEITFAVSGSKLTGTMVSERGTVSIENGEVNGNQLKWSTQISQPMVIELEFQVEVNGDELSGTVKLGMFGNAPVRGTRLPPPS